MAVIGTIANIMVFIIFGSKTYKRYNYRVFVLWLAAVDFTSCLFVIPTEMVKLWIEFDFRSEAFCKIKCFLHNWLASAVAIFLLVIALERFRKICQPLKSQMTTSLAHQLCFAIGVLSALIATPGPILCGINETHRQFENTTVFVYNCTFKKSYEGHPLKLIFKLITALVLGGGAIICIVLYVFIGKDIYKHQRRAIHRRKNTHNYENVKLEMRTNEIVATIPIELHSIKEDEHHDEISVSSPVNMETKSEGQPATKTEENTGRIDAKCTGPCVTDCHDPITDTDKRTVNVSGRRNTMSGTLRKALVSQRDRIKRRFQNRSPTSFSYKTLIWFILTLIHVSTNALSLVVESIFPDFSVLDIQTYSWVNVVNNFYLINNIINPFVYTALDKRFRHGLVAFYRNRICRTPIDNESTLES
ncbi:neuropeptides capa receptor-like [Mya arenaria]|uniref:neuropeptides capa receptor-like n=1 Tax=Mya arenaria TaxID=6604 RepID=UPI0022E8D7E3|nr:neuropeptides capa receptor-like [Mya arenaria]